MTNDTKNVPELRFPGFSGEWEIKELGDRVKFYSGLTYTPNDVSKNGTLVLRSSNIFNNHIINADNVYVNSDKATSTYVEYGDVVVVVRNGSRNLIGKHAVVKKEETNAVIGAFMTGIRYEFGSFINALLSTQNFQKEIHKNLGATINQITTGIFKKMPFSFPKKQEEQKIGEFFSKLDRQIELEEQKLEKLEAQKKGYMQQIFSHQLIFKDKNGATYPEWKTLKIKDIAEILRGLTYKPEDIRVAGIRVLRSSNIIKDKFHTYKDDIFVDKSVVKIPLVNKGDILITAANGSPKLVGKHAIIEKLDDESVAGGFMYILRSDNSKFIQIWMSTMEYKRIISRVQGGNGSIGNLSRNDLENGYITLPCDEEQNKIGNFFNKFDELIEKQNQKIDGLKERKKGFLQKMFV
ncbi:restriction endonuclease subunit S [Mammaliicoccus sp. Dog046]|uniref:restriction endonuclease subunit S n=1 Tax=Mammaliicoccus sp. Dog046 TaxID=3034233 RepID=UPI002B25E9DA|nr:restriction endonuclease subunit S [Mammaliicoccus sp. Dog046]WQK85501.1 restriction endonuclease subunit S [Mammaliicoccus sp. Dog046]